MRFPGVETVTHLARGPGAAAIVPRMAAGRPRRLHCDLGALRRLGKAAGRIRRASSRPRASSLIHANHVFSLPLARRIAAIVYGAQGRRPRILLETHDVQSDAFAARRQKNPHSRRIDAHADLLKTELALCAAADLLVHVTRADFDFFAGRLPDKRHAVILPTLNPESEAELVQRRGVQRPGRVRLHLRRQPGTKPTWRRCAGCLARCCPSPAPASPGASASSAPSARCCGRRDPALFARHRHLFAGEVPSVCDCYARGEGGAGPGHGRHRQLDQAGGGAVRRQAHSCDQSGAARPAGGGDDRRYPRSRHRGRLRRRDDPACQPPPRRPPASRLPMPPSTTASSRTPATSRPWTH